MNEPDLKPPSDTSDASPSPGSATPAKSNRSAMMIVFLVVVIDLLGFGIILPLLPRIANDYARDLSSAPNIEIAKDASTPAEARTSDIRSGVITGALMACFSLMQFLFAPSWGRLSDRRGRRPVLLIGLLGSVVFYAMLGYAASLSPETHAGLALALFFISRIGAGVAGATISTAQAVIADCTPPEKRKHGMAMIGAAFGIGFTFGPIIGFFALTSFGGFHGAIGYIASALSLAALLLGIWLLPETRRFGEQPTARSKVVDFSAVRFALTSPSIAPILLTFFFGTLGFGAFETTLALLLRDAFELPETDSYRVFAYIGFVLVLTQGGLYRPLAKRLAEVSLMGVGIAFMAIGVGWLAFVTYSAMTGGEKSWFMLMGALTTSVVGFAFLTPSAQALISRRTPANRQGEVLGVNQSASAMARILGPLAGIPLYKATATHMLPYIFGAVLVGVMIPLLPRMRREPSAEASTEPAK